jgi:DnaJ-class molecular chaperone
MEDATAIVLGFANFVDALFLRYTGKTMGDLLKESAQRPRELPTAGKTPSPQAEKPVSPAEPDMPLEWAYSILGLKSSASTDEVKRNYRNLARVFHSDKGLAMNDEAMKLLNKAYARILKEKGD